MPARQEARVVDQLIPSLAALVEGFRPCFRHEVFQTFQHLLVGWVVCPGPRTISEVWPATGRAATHHHDTAYSLFCSAVWEWDELGKILLLLIVARLIPPVVHDQEDADVRGHARRVAASTVGASRFQQVGE